MLLHGRPFRQLMKWWTLVFSCASQNRPIVSYRIVVPGSWSQRRSVELLRTSFLLVSYVLDPVDTTSGWLAVDGFSISNKSSPSVQSPTPDAIDVATSSIDRGTAIYRVVRAAARRGEPAALSLQCRRDWTFASPRYLPPKITVADICLWLRLGFRVTELLFMITAGFIVKFRRSV